MYAQITPNLPGSNNGAESTKGRRVDQYDRGYDRGDGCAEGRDYEAAALAVKGKLTSHGYHDDGFVVEDGDDFSGDEYEEDEPEFSDEEEEDEPEFSDDDEEEEPEFSDGEEEEEWEPEFSDGEEEREPEFSDGEEEREPEFSGGAEEEDVEQRAERMASEVENIMLKGLPGGDDQAEAAQVVPATLPPPGTPLTCWTGAEFKQMEEAYDKFYKEFFCGGNEEFLYPLLDEGLPGLLKHFASPLEAMLGLIMSHIELDQHGQLPIWPDGSFWVELLDGSGEAVTVSDSPWTVARLVYQQIARQPGIDMLSLITGRASTEALTKQVAAAYHDLAVTPEDNVILLCEELIDAEHCRDTPRILACLGNMNERVVVTEQLLRETGVGKLVNRIRKYEDDDGLVRSAARMLVMLWRAAVAPE